MHDQLAEKFAALFAQSATTGDTAELRKEAAAYALVKAGGITDVVTNPFVLAPLAGATLGGAAGYLGTKKDKRKLRNALYGALTGGLGGLGGAMFLPQAKPLLTGEQAGAEKADSGKDAAGGDKAAPAAGDKAESGDKTLLQRARELAHSTVANMGGDAGEGKPRDWTTNSISTPRVVADAASSYGGYRGGSWSADALYKKIFSPHIGELDRLATTPPNRGGAGKPANGKAPSNPYTDPVTRMLDRHVRGTEPVTASFAPIPEVGPMPDVKSYFGDATDNTHPEYGPRRLAFDAAHQAYQRQVAAKLEAEARHAANKPIAEALLKARNASAPTRRNRGIRANELTLLQEMMEQNGLKRVPGVAPGGPGTLHTDLKNVGRQTPKSVRRVGGVAGAVAAPFIMDPVINALQNNMARWLNHAPTPDK